MGLFAAIFAIGTVIGSLVVSAAKSIGRAVSSLFEEKVHQTMDRTIDTLFRELDEVKSTLRDRNDHISDLEAKLRRDGDLTTSELEELEHLRTQRSQGIQRWGYTSAELIRVEEDQHPTDQVVIDSSRLHIVEGHVGLTNLQKRCNQCGLFMVLRRNKNNTKMPIDGFFWACPSWFNPATKHVKGGTESLRLYDMSLFARKDIQDWHVDRATLDTIVKQTEPIIKKRVSQLVSEKIDRIVCGVHGEPLQLFLNKNASGGLLTIYSLRCVRPECTYAVAISSAGQLTALLSAAEGTGIL